LADWLLALERRRIAHPKGLGLRRFSKWDYSRDLRPVEWGSGAVCTVTAKKFTRCGSIGKGRYDPTAQNPPLKKFFRESRMRISAGMGKFGDQVSVISMTWWWRGPPLGALSEGVSTFTSG
jgi:hypothetical protein